MSGTCLYRPAGGNADAPLVLFAGGGTGGHLMPALATARVLKESAGKAECMFLVSDRIMAVFHELMDGYRVAVAPEVRWRGPAYMPAFICRSMQLLDRTLELFGRHRPDIVVGMGGWGCAPAIAAARMMRIPAVIFEANAVPGRAVRALAGLCDAVHVQWSDAADGLRCKKTFSCGMPVRPELFSIRRDPACRRYGFDPCLTTVLVMGGTQGAVSVNRMLVEALPHLATGGLRLQVLHMTGTDHLEEFRRIVPPGNVTYRPVGFEIEMKYAYAASDFAVSRAGGGTLAELSALGLPAILLPYPHAADGHQLENAKKLAEAGGAFLMEQHRLTPEKLARAILTLAGRRDLRVRMARLCRAAGRPGAARETAREIIQICRRREAVYVPVCRKDGNNMSGAGIIQAPRGRDRVAAAIGRLGAGGYKKAI